MKKILLFLAIVLVLVSCATSGETAARKKMEKQEMARKVNEAITNRHFKVNVNMVLPMGGSPISPSTLYSVTIAGDSINSYLPYFGRAYDIPYGGGKGLNFEGTIGQYSHGVNARKGEHQVTLYVENEEDIYRYDFSIFDNGSASIDVIARKRNPISYTGYLDLDGE